MDNVKNNHPTVMDEMITSLQYIGIGETADSAATFFRAANWNFDEALQLFYSSRNQEESEETESDDDDNSKADNLYPPPIDEALMYDPSRNTGTSCRFMNYSQSNVEVE